MMSVMHKRKHLGLSCLIIILSIVGIRLLSADSAAAQTVASADSECSASQTPYYDALVEAPSEDYDVYVKMGKRGHTAAVSLYDEASDTGACVMIGSGTAVSETWTRLGLWKPLKGESSRLQLTSAAFTDLPDANRPTVMLVPHINPPCLPTTECTTVVEGQPAYINPPGTLLSEDSLHVTRVVEPSADTLVRVDYYAGGQFLYSTPTLQPFDLRYVPGGQHTVSRVMQYESKQQVVLPQEVYVSFASDFRNLLFRLLNSNKVTIQIVAGLAVVVALATTVLAVVHAVHRRRLWKEHHGLVKAPTEDIIHPGSQPISSVSEPHYISTESTIIRKTRQLLPYTALAVMALLSIVIIDSYVMQIFRVDGESMETTLQTDDKLLVSKLEQTFSSLNRQEYVPRRGEVVVFHKAHSEAFKNLLDPSESETYVVKRVIGLPGERVVMKDGVITVYNEDNPDGFQPDATGEWKASMIAGTQENIDLTLGAGEVFVIGDNRPGSLDSRTNGPIQLNEIVGRARARILPFSKRQLL